MKNKTLKECTKKVITSSDGTIKTTVIVLNEDGKKAISVKK